jgi:hypothetical protein
VDIAVSRTHIRIAYAGLAAALLAAAVLEAVAQGTGYWQLAAFALGPDLALVYGVGAGLERGQLHPRAVWLYNLLHRFWLPAALAVVAAAGLVPVGYLVGALAWGFHIALDRAVGYRLRTSDGFQRA